MILSVTLNPCVDRVLFVDGLLVSDTNRVVRTETDAGGKGVNLSRVAVELGAKSLATGFLGGGPGAYVRQVLDGQGVQHDFVEVEEDTRINFSVEDGSGAPPTTFNERGANVTPEEWDALVAKMRSFAGTARWVALGGSLPPGVPVDAFKILGDVAHECGCKLLLDADGEPQVHGLEAKPDLIKPNAAEAGRLLGKPVQTDEQALGAVRELAGKLGRDAYAIISRGSQGAVLSCAAGTFVAHPIDVQVKSTIGSGDSLLGGFLAGIERGLDVGKAFALGNAAGAATAMTDGSEIARKPVVESLLPRAKVERVG